LPDRDGLANVVDIGGSASAADQSGFDLHILTGLLHHGKNRALSSGATEVIASDIEALEEHARAIARETFRQKFDPNMHHHDRLEQAEYLMKLSPFQGASLSTK